jgi:hypothetical protein
MLSDEPNLKTPSKQTGAAILLAAPLSVKA